MDFLFIMEYLRQPLKGYETKYEIDTLGNVFSNYQSKRKNKEYKLSNRLDNNGYVMIDIDGNRTRLHRILAKQFIPNPNNYPFINHINGIKNDNRLENLEWCTCKMNNDHAKAMGLRNILGSNHGYSKLTENKVLEIREMKAKFNYSNAHIGRIFNVVPSTIWNIIKRETWTHI